MKITHADGVTIDTDNLGDVDAILMEESAKLHKLFAKYNRQMLLLGQMKGSAEAKAEECSFFHLANKEDTVEVINEKLTKMLRRVDSYLRFISNGQLFVARSSTASPE